MTILRLQVSSWLSSDLSFKNSACAASNSGANLNPQTGDKHADASIVARIDPVISEQ
jgi:hypothetical protein